MQHTQMNLRSGGQLAAGPGIEAGSERENANHGATRKVQTNKVQTRKVLLLDH